MITDSSTSFLVTLHQGIATSYSLEEVRSLCFELGVDFENIPGDHKSAFVRNLILVLARQGGLAALLGKLRASRPKVSWPEVPPGFRLPESLLQEDIRTVSQFAVYGDFSGSEGIAIGPKATAIHIDALGDVGDVITGTKISLVNRAVAARVASKRQVAAPPSDYIPRPEPEAMLTALLTAPREGFQSVYLYGLPGVGKSWLVRRVASSLTDAFPDGILSADLENSNIRTAVWKFIEPYDENISRASLTNAGEFTAAMQAAIGDRRVLIVLDHLDAWRENWQELREWLPYECRNCVVLLLAHQSPTHLRENESNYRLGGMTPDESVKLFARRLIDEDGAVECDEKTMLALAEKLDFIPAEIDDVARDINVRLITPEDYLLILTARRSGGDSSGHWPRLDTVYAKLPPDGQALLPYLGLLASIPWAPDDLAGISLRSGREIAVGLAHLQRAGMVESLEYGRYRTPATVADYALHKLKELGGSELEEAARALRTADILRKAELILRYARQSILVEVWQDKSNRSDMISSVDRQFSNQVTASIRKSEDTNLLTVPLDPLGDFFEDVVLTRQPYVQDWLDMMESSGLPRLRGQLESVFDWAVVKEDWSLIRRFANRLGVNTSWIINTDLSDSADGKNWVRLGFEFALLKNITARDVEIRNAVLKGTKVKSTTWTDCSFIDSKWHGAHVSSSTFLRNDMVGMILHGGVITGCTFADVDARHADFRGTIFQQCKFDRVNMRSAQLQNAKFIDCYFADVDLRLTALEEDFTSHQR